MSEKEKKDDEWFYNICVQIAKKSKCLSRHVGAILVRDGTIISQGYNGPPKKSPHCNERYLLDPILRDNMKNLGKDPDDKQYHTTCPRYVLGFKSGEGLGYCVAGHGERNALINAAANGISTKDSIMYMDCTIPCTPCLVEIINSGVKEIIVTGYSVYDVSSMYLIKNSKLLVRQYRNLCKHERTVGNYCIDCKMDLIEKKD
jgi:dCMP deaminase